jgi:hypothetical protein
MNVNKLLSGKKKLLVTLGAIALKVLRPEIPDEVLIMAGTYVAGESIADAAGAARATADKLKVAREAARELGAAVGVVK